MSFEESMPEIASTFRNYGERTGVASEWMEDVATERFHQMIESDILPLFHKTAHLLKDRCTVLIRRQEHTTEGPLVVSVAMIITPTERAHLRRLRQPYPKFEICLRQKTPKVVIFTEQLRSAKLQIEEMSLRELNPAKLEQCVHNFVVEIFR